MQRLSCAHPMTLIHNTFIVYIILTHLVLFAFTVYSWRSLTIYNPTIWCRPDESDFSQVLFRATVVSGLLSESRLNIGRAILSFEISYKRSYPDLKAKYLQSCRQRSSSSAAPAVWGPPRCRSAGCARSCARWPWTCSKSQPGTSLRSVPIAPPCTWCSLHPGWWSSSPDQTPHQRAEKERKTGHEKTSMDLGGKKQTVWEMQRERELVTVRLCKRTERINRVMHRRKGRRAIIKKAAERDAKKKVY